MINKDDIIYNYMVCHQELMSAFSALNRAQIGILNLRSKYRKQQQQIKYLCKRIKELENEKNS